MLKQQKYFLFILGAILIVVFIMILLSMLSQRSREQAGITPIPTPFQQNTEPPVLYQEGSVQKAAEKMKNPGSLSTSDKTIRDKFVSQLGNKSGEIHATTTFRLTYMQVFNLFESEILTTNISQAKQDTILYLTQQGLTQQGICNLPLTFFLNYEVSNQLRNQNVTFNPLPEGC